MKKEIKIKLWIYIFMIITMLIGACTLIYSTKVNQQQDSCIKRLEQNNIEQIEEKEVYINRCKMYEDFLKVNGLLDECRCR